MVNPAKYKLEIWFADDTPTRVAMTEVFKTLEKHLPNSYEIVSVGTDLKDVN